MIRIELYPFSYYDQIRKKWVRARYKAALDDIRARHPEHRIDGPPEIRDIPSEQPLGLFPPIED